MNKRLLNACFLVFAGLGFLVQSLQAQDLKRACGNQYLPDQTSPIQGKRKGPEYDIKNQAYHVIPTVVHVMYADEADSIPPSRVKSQIRVLNEDFGRYGNGTNNFDQSSDTKIRFCLANKNPDGDQTNGIIYKQVNNDTIRIENQMALKNQSRWPSDQYLNIWVVEKITSDRIESGSGSLSGFAPLPRRKAGEPSDGVVVVNDYFGENNDRFYGEGKTASHEVGHYLDLFHTWGPGANSGCTDDDGVDDTPLCQNPFFIENANNPCQPNSGKHECSGIERMTENYMDYSVDECLRIFTNGQKERMRKAIANYRSRLVSFPNVHDAGCAETFDSLNSQETVNNNLYPKVELFPNPAKDYIYVSAFAKDPSNLVLKFYDISGSLVKTVEKPAFKTDKVRVSVKGLSPGLYILETQFSKESKRQKIVITNNRN